MAWFITKKGQPPPGPLPVLVPDPNAGSDQLRGDLIMAKNCIMDYWQSHRDKYSNDYNNCELPEDECLWCAEAAVGLAAIDRALHILRDMK